MNKILFNMIYKMKYQFSWAVWYPVIYMISMPLVYFGLMHFTLISVNEGSLVYRFWGSVIFQFAISMRFKEDFDFFLILSSTRREIFYSLSGVAACYSLVFTILIVVERVVIDLLNKFYGFENFTDPVHFFSPYVNDNIAVLFLFFLALTLCLSMFGLLMGSLFYRYGKKFIFAFWLLFSSIPVIILPLFIWPIYKSNRLAEFIAEVGGFMRSFDVTECSGYMLLLTVTLGLAAYANIRRLPQV